MLLTEPADVRRFVGRLERGDAVPDVFVELAHEQDIAAAWVTALGAFEYAEICEYDQDKLVYRPPVEVGPSEVISLTGNISMRRGEPFVHLHAALSLKDGAQVWAGHLNHAKVFALEFRVEAFEGTELVREVDDATGLDLWSRGGLATGVGAPQVSGEVTWEAAAQVSAETGRTKKAKRNPLSRGDWIEHPKFGLCRVESLNEGVLIIKLSDARRKKFKLDALEVLKPRYDKNRAIYPVRPRQR